MHNTTIEDEPNESIEEIPDVNKSNMTVPMFLQTTIIV